MKILPIIAIILTIPFLVGVAGVALAQAGGGPLPAPVFQNLRNAKFAVRIPAFEQIMAIEQAALDNDQPIPPKIRQALNDLLRREETEAADKTATDYTNDEEYLPELIESVIALHDISSVDLLLNALAFSLSLTAHELARYGDAIVPKLVAIYEAPFQTDPNYDGLNARRFDLMMVMIDMIETHTVKNADNRKKFESIFIANAQLNGDDDGSLRALAIRGLQYFTDPEARRWVQGALNDSDYGVRSEGERALKAQNQRLNAQ